jgi:hypothetical protein
MKYLFSVLFVFVATCALSQNKLQPGFNATEYAQLLSLAYYGSGIPDSAQRVQALGSSKGAVDPYRREYRSPEVGLKNRWTLYLRNDNVAVIDLRGTVNQMESWMANFYAAMIPATGSLQINDSTRFDYQLATDTKAAVHVGWTVALAHLAPDIEQKINSYYTSKKVKEFLIFGHSQGGALAFLLRSWLEYERKKGKIPADIAFKTYCSAAPKTGNMFYAYDFDFITRGGWAFTVVNTADWVPETPFSIQQVTDFNVTNPLIHAKDILKKQKFIMRFVGNMIYKKVEKKPRKAQKKLERYLGKVLYKRSVSKILPQFKEPQYSPGNNYMRAGAPIILLTDEEYLQRFPDSDQRFFVHHNFSAYYFLLKKWYTP